MHHLVLKNVNIHHRPRILGGLSHVAHGVMTLFAVMLITVLASCAHGPTRSEKPLPTAASESAQTPVPAEDFNLSEDTQPLAPARTQAKSRWVPVRWAELPGFTEDRLFEAWNAWVKNCERPGAVTGPVFAPLCSQVRQLSIATADVQRRWMVKHLQPYRIEPLTTSVAEGLLTAYYEPVLDASRLQRPGFGVPLHRPPAGLPTKSGRPWFSRQEISTLPEARAALAGREIAWLADPVDVMTLHIQGSGRLALTEADGSQRTVRVAFAGTNEQPYKSVGRWLIDQGLLRDASWPAIKGWIAQNPQRVQEMLWSNPRYVFFKKEALAEGDVNVGPKGAQGVPLTAGRSIAVDPGSIPFGTPVWLASSGPTAQLQRLVFAQDTGSAIVGAVRADYFMGSGLAAGESAGRMKQSLKLWALWPR
jgi:membrane-bound lytic murein transglycosylase A